MTVVDVGTSGTLTRLLSRIKEIAALPLELATTLPPEVYTSEALYALEVDKLFRHEWMCVGRTDEVPNPGDFLSVDLVGEPLVLTRDDTGDLHVLSRVCRHRGAEVCHGNGNARNLQCPYHHWTYSLSGDLLSAPLMRENIGFERLSNPLPAIRTEIWQGFVFVNLDGTADPLGPSLAGLDALLEPYDLASFRTVRRTAWGDSPYDWKLLVDNYLECYHHLGVHNTSVQPAFPTQLTWTDPGGDDRWSVAHVPVAAAAEVIDEQNRAVAPRFLPPPPGLGVTQLREILIVGVFPFFLFGVNPDFVEWYHGYPTGSGRLDLTVKFCVHPQQLEFPLADHCLAGVVDCLRTIHEEDIQVLEAMQRGARSRLSREGALSPYEEPIQQFQRYLANRLTPS